MIPKHAAVSTAEPSVVERHFDIRIGKDVSEGPLTVMPIAHSPKPPLPEFDTLMLALACEKAEVSELPVHKLEAPTGRRSPVRVLEVRNWGDAPIYLLAGTFLKGGKQDRQVQDDFVVPAGQSVCLPVTCVERGRWGVSLESEAPGAFHTSGALTQSGVRCGGQYLRSQRDVWKRVDALNQTLGVHSATASLAASLDHAELGRRVDEWQPRLTLAASLDNPRVTGFAFGISGQLRAVRWFTSRAVFSLFASELLRAAMVEALQVSESALVARDGVREQLLTQLTELAGSGRPRECREGPASTVEITTTPSGYACFTWFTGQAQRQLLSVDYVRA